MPRPRHDIDAERAIAAGVGNRKMSRRIEGGLPGKILTSDGRSGTPKTETIENGANRLAQDP